MIELAGVSKVFEADGGGDLAAVTDLSLTLPAGSTTLITGPSGSGKSTLLGLIGCLVRPTAGRIRVEGREVTRMPEEQLAGLRRRCFGFVFQNHHLIRGASALTNVMLPALPAAEFDGNLPRLAGALLTRLGLAARAGERAGRLSGGEQQRVAIARALIYDPPVLLADEPTAHLDAETAGAFLELLAELRREGRTLVVASHDPLLCDALGIFSRRFELRAGRLHKERPSSSAVFSPALWVPSQPAESEARPC